MAVCAAVERPKMPTLAMRLGTIASQMAAANTYRLVRPSLNGGTRRRKRKSAARTAPRRRTSAKRKRMNGGRKARMVKGSRAAKAYMAKLRRMRRR
jgi:hypothetical protein